MFWIQLGQGCSQYKQDFTIVHLHFGKQKKPFKSKWNEIFVLTRVSGIDATQSGLKGLSQTLYKTIQMRYDAQVHDSTLVAKALGVSQE